METRERGERKWEAEFEEEGPEPKKREPKGRRWLDRVMKQVDLGDYEEDPTYKANVSRVKLPSGGVFRDYLRLMCTSDPRVVCALMGVGVGIDLDVDERLKKICDLFVERILSRGNDSGLPTDRMLTNKNYSARQMELLEFIEDESLQSSYADVSAECGAELGINFEWIHLVTEDVILKFMEKKKADRMLKGDKLGSLAVISLTDLREQHRESGADRRPTRMKKQRLGELGTSDATVYRQAIHELFIFQRSVLDVEKELMDFQSRATVRNWFGSHTNQVRSHNRFMHLDKAIDSVKAQPTIAEKDALMDHWFRFGVGSRAGDRDAYRGALCIALWLNASGAGLQRYDEVYRCLLSDREVVMSSDYSSRSTGMEIPIFLARSRMGKPNKKGNLTYVAAVPNKEPLRCPCFADALLLVLRFDLMGISLPQFDMVLTLTNGTPFRPWFFDFCYPSLESRIKRPFRYRGDNFPEVNMDNKHPFGVQSASTSFEQAYTAVGINSKHLLHLPRSNTAIRNGFSSVPLETTKRMGHWSISQDVFETSYGLIPDLDSLVTLSGFESAKTYKPHWLLTEPPPELLQIVLPGFVESFKFVLENRELANKISDKMRKALLHDRQALFSLHYITHLRVLFVKGAVRFQRRYPGHYICRKHKLFRSPIFHMYAALVNQVDTVLSSLETVLPFLMDYSQSMMFVVSVNPPDDEVTLRHKCDHYPTKRLLDLLCEKIGSTALNGMQDPSGRSRSSAHETIAEIVSAFSYSDLKTDMALVTSALSDLSTPVASLAINSQISVAEQSVSLPCACTDAAVAYSSDTCLVPSLPLLGNLGPNPIARVVQIWREGTTLGGDTIPSLRDLPDPRKSKVPLYGDKKGSKAVQTRSGDYRKIGLAIDLLEGGGLLDAKTIDNRLAAREISTSKFAKKLGEIFKKMKVTDGNKQLSHELISNSENFDLFALDRELREFLHM